MAQEYVILKDKSELGMIAINKSVIQSISEISIRDIENASIAPVTRFSKPVVIRIEDNKLMVEADIEVKYGANASVTSELVQNKIYENILFMTGFKASDIAINVVGFNI